MLISYEFWDQAMEEMCRLRLNRQFEEYLKERARDMGVTYVNSLLNRKKAKYNLS